MGWTSRADDDDTPKMAGFTEYWDGSTDGGGHGDDGARPEWPHAMPFAMGIVWPFAMRDSVVDRAVSQGACDARGQPKLVFDVVFRGPRGCSPAEERRVTVEVIGPDPTRRDFCVRLLDEEHCGHLVTRCDFAGHERGYVHDHSAGECTPSLWRCDRDGWMTHPVLGRRPARPRPYTSAAPAPPDVGPGAVLRGPRGFLATYDWATVVGLVCWAFHRRCTASEALGFAGVCVAAPAVRAPRITQVHMASATRRAARHRCNEDRALARGDAVCGGGPHGGPHGDGASDLYLCGVFDGHGTTSGDNGGVAVLGVYRARRFFEEAFRGAEGDDAPTEAEVVVRTRRVRAALRETLKRIDAEAAKLSGRDAACMGAVACLCVVDVRSAPPLAHFAVVGDCFGVVLEGERWVRATTDQTCIDASERARVAGVGSFSGCDGAKRVAGNYAPSRVMGDHGLKALNRECGDALRADADLSTVALHPATTRLCLMSDGILLCRRGGAAASDPAEFAAEIVAACGDANDDATAVVVNLAWGA